MGNDKINKSDSLPNKEIDESYYHEAQDRCYLVSSIIEEHILNHPVFEKHLDLRVKIERAQKLIIEVYQSTGALEYLKSIETQN